MLLRHAVTLVGGGGGGMRSNNASFATRTVAAVPKALLHERGCGPIVEVFPEPGILLANLRTLSVRRLGTSRRGAREHTTSRTSERGPASTSRQTAVVGIPAASIALWIDAYGGRERELVSRLEWGEVTYNERVVGFFTDSRTPGKER